jgi:hypothetical protein
MNSTSAEFTGFRKQGFRFLVENSASVIYYTVSRYIVLQNGLHKSIFQGLSLSTTFLLHRLVCGLCTVYCTILWTSVLAVAELYSVLSMTKDPL